MSDEYIDFDSVGNLSILYFQKHVRRSEAMMASVVNPLFSSQKFAAHVIHKSHHADALEFMSANREDRDLAELEPTDPAGVFPFFRSPTTANRQALGAFWGTPSQEQRFKFEELAAFVENAALTSGYVLDVDQTVDCCRGCNMTMTMEFWFRYHLYNPANAARLIPADAITVVKMNVTGRHVRDDWSRWRFAVNRENYTFPSDEWSKGRDAMAAAVAYYLHACLPFDESEVKTLPEKKRLYLSLCWTVLEIACLLCELKIGPESKGTKKKRQCPKSHVGAIELYVSHFCWRLYTMTRPALMLFGFERWHQIYFCEAVGCKELFPRRQFGQLIVDEFAGDVSLMTSRKLLRFTFKKVWSIFQALEPLADFLCARYERIPPNVGLYFLNPDSLEAVYTLANGGHEPSFDSYASCLGVDALLSRLLDTCRDFDEETRALLASFRTSWRNAEIAAVSRAQYGGREASRARVDYLLCRVLDPPEGYPASREELAKILRGPKCSAWAAVLPLHQMGAFSG